MTKQSNKILQKFKPTAGMKKCLLAYADMSLKPTIEARMEAIGMSRLTWYDWVEIEGFVEWWSSETQKIMQRSLSELDKIAYMKAGQDFRYMKMLQMKYGGFCRKEKIEMDLTVSTKKQEIKELYEQIKKDVKD